MGVLSHKLRNCTHTGKVIAFCLRFVLGHMFVSPTPLSPVYRLDVPSTRKRIYFYRLQAQVFRVGRRSYTISIDLSMFLLIVLVVYTSCGALDLQSIKLQISLDDAAVQDSTLESAIFIFQTVCDCTLQY